MDELQATAARNTQLFIIWLAFLGSSVGILYGLSRVFRPQLKLAMHGALEIMTAVGSFLFPPRPPQSSQPPQTASTNQISEHQASLSHASSAPVVVNAAEGVEDKAERLRKRRQIIEALAVRQRPTGAWFYDTHEIREIVGGDINKVAPMVTQFREAFEAELAAATI